MITLATGAPSFRRDGEIIFLSIPSGEGAPFEVALSRHQLAHLTAASKHAAAEAFNAPQPNFANVEPIARPTAAR